MLRDMLEAHPEFWYSMKKCDTQWLWSSILPATAETGHAIQVQERGGKFGILKYSVLELKVKGHLSQCLRTVVN